MKSARAAITLVFALTLMAVPAMAQDQVVFLVRHASSTPIVAGTPPPSRTARSERGPTSTPSPPCSRRLTSGTS